MDEILVDLEAQHAELWVLLEPLDQEAWHLASPCEGWDIADVVLHLHQTDVLAITSLRGDLTSAVEEFVRGGDAADDAVDTAAALSVEQARGASGSAVLDHWRTSSIELRELLRVTEPGTRVQWVAGRLSARTLAATRLAECWIHTGDVAVALGIDLAPTNRLRHIARLAWRTVPYAFERAGRELAGPVAFDLVGPDGDAWTFGMESAPSTIVRGNAHELCRVAGRRSAPGATGLMATGPDGHLVLELVRTYA